MLRNSIAFIVAIYAIGFALAALTAVRWPSLLLVASFAAEVGPLADVQALVSWRELGLTYGLAYLMAAFFFYSASTLINRAGRGSVICYVLGAGVGFPPFLLFDFEAGWWQNPDVFEQIILFAGIVTVILFSAVLELSGKQRPVGKKAEERDAVVLDKQIVPVHAVSHARMAPNVSPVRPPAQKKRRQPVPAAIARQRASFAAYGRRAYARQSR